MSIEVKVCGIKSIGAANAAVNYGAKYIGFIFYPESPRYLDYGLAARISGEIPESVSQVTVHVDPNDNEIQDMLKYFKPHYLQLHGSETTDRVKEIKEKFRIGIIKAITVRSKNDVESAKEYEDVADMLLFDAKSTKSKIPGGNGVRFDWSLLKHADFKLPWFLSGGINLSNLGEAISVTGAKKIDVSSSLEKERGVKDPRLIKEFLKLSNEIT